MATTYPNAYQEFPTMQNISATDASIVAQYQNAIENNDYPRAQQLLQAIPDFNKKMITASLLNTVFDTNVALQKFYTARYNPAYVVSKTQPLGQEVGDFWIKVED